MSSVAHAVAPPAVAAAPPIRRKADPMAETQEAPQRLLTSLSSVPAVQRKCASCEAKEHEETMPVQPRLEVGPVDDPYEREADNIADRVMAMRDAGSVTGAPATVQRACTNRSGSDDEVRRKMNPMVAITEDDEDKLRMRADAAGGGETITASAGRLTAGGSSLPGGTREYFEPRMGRDLSEVRVHQGGEADALNRSIGARAFTYQNHIWLSRSEGSEPSHTMAHEMAHVLQQTQPGPLGGNGEARSDGAPRTIRRTPSNIVSDTVFFAPARRDPDWAHDRAVRDVTRRNRNVLGELRVPNANSSGAIYNDRRFGFADLVLTEDQRIWGLGFVSANPGQEPWPWYISGSSRPLRPVGLEYWRTRNMFRNGRTLGGVYANGLYRRQSAPYWRHGDIARDASEAPASYEIGDMKFVGHRDRTDDARDQTSNYARGFNFAKANYNRIVDQSNAVLRGSNSANRQGSSRHGELPRSSFSASQMITSVGDRGFIQLPGTLPLKLQNYRPGRGFQDLGGQPYTGKSYYRQHPTNRFLWEYVYWPNRPGEQDDTSSRRLRRSRLTDASSSLFDQLTTSPTGNRVVRRRPDTRPTADAPRVMPVRRRRPLPPSRDPFVVNYPQWRTQQRSFTSRFNRYADLRRGTGRREVSKLAFDTAIENTMRELGGTAPAGRAPRLNTTALHRAQREFNSAELISGRSGRVLGQVRKTFGQTFIKALNIYVRLREKFQRFLERGRRRRTGGSAKLRAMMKVAGVIFGTIIKMLLPQVGAYLVACVEQGFNRMFREFLDRDFSEMTEAAEEEIMRRYEEAAGRIEEQIESTAEQIKARYGQIYEAVMDHFAGAGTLIQLANHVINVARIAACALGGLETVGIACVVAGADYILGLFNASPTDHLLAWLLGSCVAQQLISEFILGRAVIRNLPREIAETVRYNVKEALPDEVSGLICDALGDVPGLPEVSDIPCEDINNPGHGGSGSDLSRPPSGVPTSTLNQRPTSNEVREHGRLDQSLIPEETQRLLQPEEPPSPGTPDVWEPPPGTPPEAGGDEPAPPSVAEAPTPDERSEDQDAPTGSRDETVSVPQTEESPPEEEEQPAGRGRRRQSIRPGELDDVTGQVSTVIEIFPGQSGGFRTGDYPDDTLFDVIIRITESGSDGIVYGPHPIRINPTRVWELGEGRGFRIRFEPDRDYVLTHGDNSVQLQVQEYVGNLRPNR